VAKIEAEAVSEGGETEPETLAKRVAFVVDVGSGVSVHLEPGIEGSNSGVFEPRKEVLSEFNGLLVLGINGLDLTALVVKVSVEDVHHAG